MDGTLGDIYNTCHVKLNKDRSGQTLTPEQFQIIAQLINIEMFKTYVGLPEQYNPDSPMNSIAYEKTQYIGDRLSPFEKVLGGKKHPPLPVDVNGYADKPEDYAYVSSILYPQLSFKDCKSETDFRTVQILTDEKFSSRLTSVIKKGTPRHPICTFRSDHLEFRPKLVSHVRFTYLRWPIAPIFDYNIDDGEINYLPPGEVHDGTNMPIGTASTSVEFEWDLLGQVDLINYIVLLASSKNRDQFMQQAALLREQKGRG